MLNGHLIVHTLLKKKNLTNLRIIKSMVRNTNHVELLQAERGKLGAGVLHKEVKPLKEVSEPKKYSVSHTRTHKIYLCAELIFFFLAFNARY